MLDNCRRSILADMTGSVFAARMMALPTQAVEKLK